MDLSKLNKNIIIFLIVVAISFFCLEVFSRIFFFISDRDIKAFKKFPGRYTHSYFSGYRLSPNWVLENEKTKEKINSLGFRSPEFQFHKDKDTYRILCLGSSLVYGTGNNEDTFPFHLEKELNQIEKDDINFEVINAGVPGYTSYHTMAQFLTSLVDLDPDLVVSYQLFTDMWYAWDISFDEMNSENFKPINFSLSFKRILDNSYFLILFNSIFRKYKIQYSNNVEPEVHKNETRNFDEDILHYFSRNIKIIAMTCDYLNIDLILSVPISLFKEKNTEAEEKLIADYENKEFYLKYIQKGKNILKSISNEHSNVYYFDPSDYINSDLITLEDRYHPTIEGNILLGKEFKNYISNLNIFFDK